MISVSAQKVLDRFEFGPTYQNSPDEAVDYDVWYRLVAQQLGWKPTDPRCWGEYPRTFTIGGFYSPGDKTPLYLARHYGAPVAAWSSSHDWNIEPAEAPGIDWDIDFAVVYVLPVWLLDQRYSFEEWVEAGIERSALAIWFARHDRPRLSDVVFNSYD